MEKLSYELRKHVYGLMVDARQAAYLIGVSIPTLHRWARSGRIPQPVPYQASKALWSLASIVGWLEERHQQA